MADRVVLITGSTRGIGLATAEEFLKHGDKVVVFCRHENHLAEALRKLEKKYSEGNILGTVGDVSNYIDVEAIVDESLDRFGTIDILINNASIGYYKPLAKVTEREWDEVLDINLKGAFLFIRDVLPTMKKNKKGTIINISSGLGVSGGAYYGAYSASKFGMVGLTEVTADELYEDKYYNIKAYSIILGGVVTKLHMDMHPWEDPETMMIPEHVAKKLFKIAESKAPTGARIEI